MTSILRLAAVALGAAMLAAPVAAATKPTVVSGIVVAREQARGTLVVAAGHGLVRTLRTHTAARVGARVQASATRLSDGTFRAAKVTAKGRAAAARVRGVVVAVKPAKLLLSAGGSVFAIGRARTTAAHGAGSVDVQPGDVVSAVVSIDAKSQGVHESDIQTVGTTTIVKLEGTISSLSSATLVLAVEKGAVTTIGIPASLTLPSSIAVGDRVEVATDYAAGAFTLVTIQDDHTAAAGGSGEGDSNRVNVPGVVAALGDGTLTIQPEHGDAVVFAVPSTVDLGQVAVGDHAVARGTKGSDGTLTLTALKTSHGKGGDGQGGTSSTVEAEGSVSAVGDGSLTIAPQHGDAVVFVVPSSFDLSHVVVGDPAAAKGTRAADGTVTLTELKTSHSSGHEPTGSTIKRLGTIGAIGGGTLTVDPEEGSPVTYTVPDSLDVSSFAVGDDVTAVGTAQADGSTLLTAIEKHGD
jgi:hypothetical protein